MNEDFFSMLKKSLALVKKSLALVKIFLAFTANKSRILAYLSEPKTV
jgi:hypothetical protein